VAAAKKYPDGWSVWMDSAPDHSGEYQTIWGSWHGMKHVTSSEEEGALRARIRIRISSCGKGIRPRRWWSEIEVGSALYPTNAEGSCRSLVDAVEQAESRIMPTMGALFTSIYQERPSVLFREEDGQLVPVASVFSSLFNMFHEPEVRFRVPDGNYVMVDQSAMGRVALRRIEIRGRPRSSFDGGSSFSEGGPLVDEKWKALLPDWLDRTLGRQA
jgi:hypothetical protein